MGIARGAARLLLDEHFKRPFNGSVLTLGRQRCFFTLSELREWAELHNVVLAEVDEKIKASVCTFDNNNTTDAALFHSLDFQSVESCDYSSYQEADQIFDLNLPAPSKLHNKYDVIYDGGTLEHVFHLPQALENIYDLLKDGGRSVHLVPTLNFVDHGFYSFSPTLFHDYYEANGWNILSFKMIEITQQHATDPWKIYDYKPGILNHLSFGGFRNGELLLTFCVAQKTSRSSKDRIPQQYRYQTYWNNEKLDAVSTAPRTITWIQGIVSFFKKNIKHIPVFFQVVRFCYRLVFRNAKKPPITDKY